jgi:hypothetical protein
MKLQSNQTFNDTVAAERLQFLYEEARIGLRRVVALGLFCFEIKAHIKHGEFQEWLQTHCAGVGFKSLEAYMTLTKNVLEGCGHQISSALGICQGGEILLLADAEVPKESRKLRDQIFDLIDGKTQRQLMLEFKSDRQPAQHHPRKPVDAKAEAEATRATAEEWIKGLIGSLRMLASETGQRNAAHCQHYLLDQLEDARIEAGKALAPMLRKKK